jgi:hypothetical protein
MSRLCIWFMIMGVVWTAKRRLGDRRCWCVLGLRLRHPVYQGQHLHEDASPDLNCWRARSVEVLRRHGQSCLFLSFHESREGSDISVSMHNARVASPSCPCAPDSSVHIMWIFKHIISGKLSWARTSGETATNARRTAEDREGRRARYMYMIYQHHRGLASPLPVTRRCSRWGLSNHIAGSKKNFLVSLIALATSFSFESSIDTPSGHGDPATGLLLPFIPTWCIYPPWRCRWRGGEAG